MSDGIDKLAKSLRKAIDERDDKKTKGYDSQATVLSKDGDILWVHIPGGADRTPVRRTVDANEGDNILVRVADGRAWSLGNATNPPTDDTRANEAIRLVMTAQSTADMASSDAMYARNSAANAEQDAIRAQGAAQTAAVAADDARRQAEAADTHASEAKTRANEAWSYADSAKSSADAAATAAQLADEKATAAGQSAQTAIDNAAAANQAAGDAQSSADAATTNANEALRQANVANTAANGALKQVSVIEDVNGTLEWIKENGSYVSSNDEHVVDGKVYFELIGDDYVPIAIPTEETVYEPSTDTSVVEGKTYYIFDSETETYIPVENPAGNPSTSGYYESRINGPKAKQWFELDIREAQTNFILSHLAVTNRGLWVLPSGKSEELYKLSADTTVNGGKTYYTRSGTGTEQDPYIYTEIEEPTGDPSAQGYFEDLTDDEKVMGGAGYKTLLTSSGMEVYDEAGIPVSIFGENISFSSTSDQKIGGENEYILFDSMTGKLQIVASNVTFSSYDTRLSDIDAALDSEKDRVDGITEGLQGDINAVNTALDGTNSAIENINTDLGTIHGDIGGINTNITNIQGDITNVQGDVNTLVQRAEVVDKAVIIDPNEPSVTVLQPPSKVKILPDSITLQGGTNATTHITADGIDTTTISHKDLHPRAVVEKTVEGGGTVTEVVGPFYFSARENGNFSLKKI